MLIILSDRYRKIYRTVKDPPIARVISPLQRFIQQEANSSKILLICIILGLIWANIPFDYSYADFWSVEISIGFGSAISVSQPLIWWINDGLMVLFFVVIGLEIKREIIIGGLNDIKDAAFSIVAALGGMIFPIVIFMSINHPSMETFQGWSVPVATDIAIALGVISLFSYKVPKKIRLILTSMAIIDDIGSIILIAIFYSHTFNWIYFLVSLAIIGILVAFNRLGFRNLLFYIIPGIGLWFSILYTGIHTTLAGVILAITIPATKRIDLNDFYDISKKSLNSISEISTSTDEVSCYTRVISQVQALENGCRNIRAPIEIIEHKMMGWVAYVVVPLFALANSGINFFELTINPFSSRLFWGIFLGLVLGKPIGVFLTTFISHRAKLFVKPANVSWLHLVAMSCLMGIGFTMSNFIAVLSFGVNLDFLGISRIAILLASIISGIVGFLLFRRTTKDLIDEKEEKSTT
ncbi:MAG: Na+/H+ antiporter NhaA [Asgard group archaeon]|nr:Na+/H+ antiporter NhaA [Asgard group archaeon]